MKFSKPKLNWSGVLFLLVDKSKGNCVADLLEEFNGLDKSYGKVRAIKWLCRQLVSSSPYLIPNPYLKVVAWFKGSWARLVGPSNLVPLTANKVPVASRVSLLIRSPASVLTLILLVSGSLLYSYLAHKRQLRSKNSYQELLALNKSIDPNFPVVVLQSNALVRGSGNSITRVELDDSTQVIHFQLELPKSNIEKSYGATLREVDAGELFTLVGLNTRDGKRLSVVLPAAIIQEGDYVFTVSDDKGNPLQDYYFRLTSKRNRLSAANTGTN